MFRGLVEWKERRLVLERADELHDMVQREYVGRLGTQDTYSKSELVLVIADEGMNVAFLHLEKKSAPSSI